MNKKEITIIIIGICIFSLVAVFIFKHRTKNILVPIGEQTRANRLDEITYDEETALYYIKEKETGKILGASHDKEELQFYIDNPNYNPNPLDSAEIGLETFVDLEEEEIEE